MNALKHITRAALLAGCALQAPAFAANAPAQHVRGMLSKISASSITVETSGGSRTLAVGAKTKVIGVVSAGASDITPGTFIGTANVTSAGPARALEVVVFPKAMAGTGEGDYPWDLPAGGKHSMMTNGTVGSAGGGHSMMTNATIANVTGGSVKTVKLTYKGGEKTVTIPADAPVVRVQPGTRALLVAGAHVVVFPGSGTAPATAIAVGEHGVVPPM